MSKLVACCLSNVFCLIVTFLQYTYSLITALPACRLENITFVDGGVQVCNALGKFVMKKLNFELHQVLPKKILIEWCIMVGFAIVSSL